MTQEKVITRLFERFMPGNVVFQRGYECGRVLLTKGSKWLKVRDVEKRTAFAFAKLLDRRGFGEEADKRRLRRLAMGLLLNSECNRRIERPK
jgi:hypothetical protein